MTLIGLRGKIVDAYDTYGRTLWETASNLAFPMAGLWNGEPWFMVTMLALGIASALYHAGVVAAHWDVGAIYVVLFYLVGIHFGIPPIFVVVPSIPLAWALRMKALDIRMELKMGAICVPLIVFGFLSGATLLTATVLLVVALAVRQWVDHGLWHVLSAGGLALAAHALQVAQM